MKLNKTKVFGKFTFYYLPSDKYIGQRIKLEKYEPYETKIILRQAKKGDVVLDIGANIGYYTILLANKVGKRGRVYAFEPDKKSFGILTKNIKANGLKNVTAINVAVGRKNETKILYKSEKNLGDHKLYDSFQFSKSNFLKEEVKIIKLDGFIKNQTVQLIKIDTQGWEPEVIGGARKIIERDKPIMFLEYSPASYEQAKLDKNEMVEFLRNIYSNIWWIDEWLYIYRNIQQEKIDQICKTNKTGYVDLWMKSKHNIIDCFFSKKDFKFKKWLKRTIFGL